MRDELVRAVMPELRSLVEHLVKTTVERSLGSLLDRQRELEATLERVVATPTKQGAATVERTAAPSLDERRELEAAVERAVAPFVAKQRELEMALADLRRAEVRPPPLPSVAAQPSMAAQRATEPTPSAVSVAASASALGARPAPVPPPLSATPGSIAVKPRGEAIAIAYDASAAIELPSELNGSRRKRLVIWLLAVGVILLLGSVAGLAVLSNTGRHF